MKRARSGSPGSRTASAKSPGAALMCGVAMMSPRRAVPAGPGPGARSGRRHSAGAPTLATGGGRGAGLAQDRRTEGRTRVRTAALVDRALEASVVGSFSRDSASACASGLAGLGPDALTPGSAASVLVTGGEQRHRPRDRRCLLRCGRRGHRHRAGHRGRPARARCSRGGSRRGAAESPAGSSRRPRPRPTWQRSDGLARADRRYRPLDVVVHNAGAMFPARGADRRRPRADLASAPRRAVPADDAARPPPRERARRPRRLGVVGRDVHRAARRAARRLPRHSTGQRSPTHGRSARRSSSCIELHRGSVATGIAFHAMHPGWARTPGLRASLPTLLTARRTAAAEPGGGGGHARPPRPRAARARRTPAPGRVLARPPSARRSTASPARRAMTTSATALWERLMADAGIGRPGLTDRLTAPPAPNRNGRRQNGA
jgi:hypothetical protein